MTRETLRMRSGATNIISFDNSWEPAGHYDPGFKDAVESEINELSSLEPNWDHYGAPTIDPDILKAGVTLVRSLPEGISYRPMVVPMSTGNFQFEWHDGPKILELEFESPTTIRFLQWDKSQQLAEEDTFYATDIERAVDLIRWFMQGSMV